MRLLEKVADIRVKSKADTTGRTVWIIRLKFARHLALEILSAVKGITVSAQEIKRVDPAFEQYESLDDTWNLVDEIAESWQADSEAGCATIQVSTRFREIALLKLRTTSVKSGAMGPA